MESTSPNPFTLNRPVHLARRDAYFEHASNQINTPVNKLPTLERIQHTDRILEDLQHSVDHAFLAAQSPDATAAEHDFLRFIRLLQSNVGAVRTMLKHQLELDGAESFLCQFLSVSPHSHLLSAMQYQRRSEDLLDGLWQLLQHAHGPYRQLKEATIKQLPESEQSRYHLAFQSFRDTGR